MTGECERVYSEEFDFAYCQTIQVRLALFSISKNTQEVIKYSRISDGRSVKKRMMNTIGKKFVGWSLANMCDKEIYLTGGKKKYFDSKAKYRSVYKFEIRAKKWLKGPDLNEARIEHGSCALGQKLYVFGGWGDHGPLNSIEVCDFYLEDAVWNVLRTEAFTKRVLSAVCAVNANQIIILGGDNNQALSQVLLFDDDSQTAEEIVPAQMSFINCQPAKLAKPGVVLSLVCSDHGLF